MSAATTLAVAAGGGLGALLRLLVGRAVVGRFGAPIARGTFVVNVTGAFVLGLLTGLAPARDLTLILGTGLLGGYTTFSTWMFETDRFAGEGAGRAAAWNVAGSLGVGLLAIWLGRAVGGG
ncbi:MAG: fluoride efflux transporter CrcB [Solirubrobacteraceae bacterium]|nr:fluoride efflux transporter CrcB [Solirubrobacteraceae bacterium]